MDRHDAYRLLSDVLERYRRLPFAELRSLVGRRHSERTQTRSGEELLLDVVVDWTDGTKRDLRVTASADSPSTFRLQRLEEHVVVSPGAA